MTDLFTHLAGQVLQPSTEIYPAITAHYAPGPDVPAVGPLPEPPGLDSMPQTAPAAFVDQQHIDQNRQTLFDPPVFPTLRDVETNAPDPASSSLQPMQASPRTDDGKEGKQAPAEGSGAPRPGGLIPAVIESPTLHADPANEGRPPAVPNPQPEAPPGFARSPSGPAGSPSLEATHLAPGMTAPPAAAFRSAVSERPALRTHPARGAASPASSLAPGYLPREFPKSHISAGQASAQEPEKESSAASRFGSSVPEVGLDDRPQAGWQARPMPPNPNPNEPDPVIRKALRPVQPAVSNLQEVAVPPAAPSSSSTAGASPIPDAGGSGPEASPASTLEGVHPAGEVAAPRAAPSPSASALPSPAPDVGRFDLILATPAIHENASRQKPQASPPRPAQTVRSQDRLLQSNRDGTAIGTPGPEKPAGLSPSPVFHPNSSRQPSGEPVIPLAQPPFVVQRAMPGSQPETLTGETALPILPLSIPTQALAQPEPETGRPGPIRAAPLQAEDTASTASSPQPVLPARRALQAGQAPLGSPQARNPGKGAGPSSGLPALYADSTIRPVTANSPALGEESIASRAEAAGSPVPTVRLTIGRIVVKAGLPEAPAASRPVPDRRQPAVSLSDYLARHGSQK